MDNVIVQHELGEGFELRTPITLPKHYAHFYHTLETSGAEFTGVKKDVRYQTCCSRRQILL